MSSLFQTVPLGFISLEALGPILLILLYAVSNWLTTRNEENKEQPKQASPQGSSERRTATDIQEEIRRRIAERQAQAQETAPPQPKPKPVQKAPSFERPSMENDWHAKREEKPKKVTPPPLAPVMPTYDPMMGESSLHDPNRALEEELARLHESERQKQLALEKVQVEEVQASAYGNWEIPEIARSTDSQDLRSLLSNADSARQAFLFAEIFERPLALREKPTYEPLET